MWFSLFSYYIVVRFSDFLVTAINNVYLSVVDWIFLIIFFEGNFEACYSFVGFVYVYCLIHQSVVVFCFVLRRRSAVQFFVFVSFSNVHVCFVLRRKSAVQFFVFVNFSNLHVCFMFSWKSAVQFCCCCCCCCFLYIYICLFSNVSNVLHCKCKCFHVRAIFNSVLVLAWIFPFFFWFSFVYWFQIQLAR